MSSARTPRPGTGPRPAQGPSRDGTAAPGEQDEHESKASLARSSAVMASGTLVSRVLGFGRAWLLTFAIGAAAPHVGAQVFGVANTLPNAFYMLLAGGVLNAVLVPQIVKASKRPDGGQDFVDRLLTLALAVMLVVTVLLTAAASLVIRLYAPEEWPREWLVLGTAMALWCLPQVFFYGLYTVLGQVLNAQGRFGAYMWAPALANVVAILGVVALLVLFPGAEFLTAREWTPWMVALLAGTTTLGIVAQALVLLVPLRRAGFRYRPRWGFRGMGLGSAGRVAGWTFAGILVGQLVYVLTTNVTSAAGAVLTKMEEAGAAQPSYLNAYLLFMLPHSIVAVSLVTALFTRISGSAVAGDVRAVRRDFSSGARTVAAAGALASVALLVLGPAIGLALFRAPDGLFIGQVVSAMALGLVPFGVMYLVQRVFYAYEDARTPFVVQVVVAAVMAAGNVAVWVLLEPQWQVVGVGWSMTASYVVGCALALVLLRRRLRSLDGRGLDGHRILRTAVRLAIISAVSGALAWAAARGLVALLGDVLTPKLLAVVVTAACGLLLLAVYAGLCRLMRVTELTDLVGPLVRRVRR
ncbi:putative peptidoglycan lipid II flippase [Kineococcus xinjiangensis]|uniref:Putative peptidoglycan lipid II flippase n=1 Tax=Kineococcus xinjiangensis TaxID=512762 RepID=A0A2S6II22_9ACTN|nr:murein biosynthesis integral membrane protein MurJ [Kineococcus xinjiangensis]PPK93835.1 putative peptidoglycan lipid II flippase [Kineococcus xinjiangensis]